MESIPLMGEIELTFFYAVCLHIDLLEAHSQWNQSSSGGS